MIESTLVTTMRERFEAKRSSQLSATPVSRRSATSARATRERPTLADQMRVKFGLPSQRTSGVAGA